MKKTKAWWVCNTCKLALVKPGKKKVREQMLDHRKVCHKKSAMKWQHFLLNK